jgi:magnesium-protoporphyrin O-methyltransferase
MSSATNTYAARRAEIETYFDRTASATWARLTSTEPVGRVRATVRAGRDRMRAALLGFLPPMLEGATVLDAGSGTGALALALAARGARVTAVELSPTLSALARERAGVDADRVRFVVGDMSDPALGEFTHLVAMDSLIHYVPADLVRILAGLAPRIGRSMVFTYAPRTPLLAAMHAVGKLFPRGDRSPAIEPVGPRHLRALLEAEPALAGWRLARTLRVDCGFYISEAAELVRG